MSRNLPQLAGITTVVAALVVVLWPGSLLALGAGALGLGTLLLLGLTLVRHVAWRRSS